MFSDIALINFNILCKMGSFSYNGSLSEFGVRRYSDGYSY